MHIQQQLFSMSYDSPVVVAAGDNTSTSSNANHSNANSQSARRGARSGGRGGSSRGDSSSSRGRRGGGARGGRRESAQSSVSPTTVAVAPASVSSFLLSAESAPFVPLLAFDAAPAAAAAAAAPAAASSSSSSSSSNAIKSGRRSGGRSGAVLKTAPSSSSAGPSAAPSASNNADPNSTNGTNGNRSAPAKAKPKAAPKPKAPNNNNTKPNHNKNNKSASSSGRSSLVSSTSSEHDTLQLVAANFEARGFSALSAQIISKLQRDVYECLVCMDRVRRHNTVWSCAHCFALFHIACITKWSRRMDALVAQSPNAPWRCPSCQHVSVGVPKASCFCGLHTGAAPQAQQHGDDGFLVAHSCGEPCGRKRVAASAGDASGCEHPCPLLCHPGPCPPCAVMGPLRSCFCGATDQRYRCSDERNVTGQSCGGPCDRKLKCGAHRCAQACHAGACAPCAVETTSLCYCGADVRQILCGTGKAAPAVARNDARAPASSEPLPRVFSCGAACGDLLECAHHRCAAPCHSGPCAPCSRSPAVITHCPCGKVPLGVGVDGEAASPSIALCLGAVRTSCEDPIPSCGQACGKLMACGVHRCTQPCHEGACGACTVPQRTTCRCSSIAAERPCFEVLGAGAAGVPPLLCSKRCAATLECGRHRCQELCCAASFNGDPEGVHICKVVCNKKLGCGKHKCQHLCHEGRCPMCLNASFDEWRCPCGGTVVEPPISCGAVMPVCRLPCRKERACGHRDSLQHPCHEGACPPCSALTQRECVGGHGAVITLPCHQLNALCGGFCRKQLVCQLHRCERRCHPGFCGDAVVEVAAAQLGVLELRPSCNGACKLPRASCGHGCAAKCHPGSPCPDVPCAAIATIACACGRRKLERVCGKTNASVLAAAEAANDAATAAAEAAAAAGDDVGTAALAAAAAVHKVDADVLECDAACVAEQRKEQLANAFGIGGRDGKKAPLFSELLRHFALASPVFVRTVERTFHHIVTSREIPIGGTHRLPPMDKMRRQIVHQLAKHYFLQTESVGEDPYRRVVLTRAADSRLPTMSLGQVAYPHVPNAVGLSALHFANLTPNVRTNHIEALLEPFRDQYRLKWLDDSNALAIFVNESESRVALRAIKGSSPFDVSLFDDLMPTLYGAGSVALTIDKDDAATTGSYVSQEDAALRRSSNSPPPSSSSFEHAAPAPRPKPLPGGWAQVAAKSAKSKPTSGSVSAKNVASLNRPRLGAADAAFGDEL
jgi:transcriptional repressor NF-X1